MNTTEVRTTQTSDVTTGQVDLKLEAVVIPVTDVDRAKAFYGSLGWRLDADFAFDNGFRVVQFTPPGSPASVQFGTQHHHGRAGLGPGPLPGRLRHPGCPRRARRARASRSARCSTPSRRAPSSSPTARRPGRRAGRRPRQLRLVRHLQRPRRQQLAAPGDHHPAARPHRHRGDVVRLGERPDAGADPRGDRPRRAREAQRRRVRRAVAGLVRRLHGRRADRRRAAGLTHDHTSRRTTNQQQNTIN